MDVVSTRGVTKIYRIGVGSARMREALPWPADRIVSGIFPKWWSRNTFNSLDDVSISVAAGSSVGIVGHNGAGKTTLLKVVSGVTAPSRGKVEVSGRVGALLDVVMGFHVELTGRENAYLLGSIYGLGRKAMDKRMDQIFDFAEIGDLADTPLKRYSAGMVARLGFSTITSIDIDVLLVDEVLAVGDSNFQTKCIRWLDGYRGRGGTLMFVSHNLSLVRHMTDRVIWLDHGRVVADGSAQDVLADYARGMGVRDVDQRPNAKGPRIGKANKDRGLHRWGAGGAIIQQVEFSDPDEDNVLVASIRYEASDLEKGVFCLGFIDEADRDIGVTSSPPLLLDHTGVVRCNIRLPFRPGIYFPVAAILSPEGQVCDRWRLDGAVVVERGYEGLVDGFGPVLLDGSWSCGD
jgi:ABC-type polysaccharide/polyol phosphate transport system ATPase subunit